MCSRTASRRRCTLPSVCSRASWSGQTRDRVRQPRIRPGPFERAPRRAPRRGRLAAHRRRALLRAPARAGAQHAASLLARRHHPGEHGASGRVDPARPLARDGRRGDGVDAGALAGGGRLVRGPARSGAAPAPRARPRATAVDERRQPLARALPRVTARSSCRARRRAAGDARARGRLHPPRAQRPRSRAAGRGVAAPRRVPALEGRLMLRPRPARWFEILAARDDATLVLEALARTGAIELEARASAGMPPALAELAPLLSQYADLATRHHAYWPAADTCRPSAFPEAPIAALQRSLATIRAWSHESEPVIRDLQRCQLERDALRQWQPLLGALSGRALDPALLAGAGPWLGVRLFVVPPGAETGLTASGGNESLETLAC